MPELELLETEAQPDMADRLIRRKILQGWIQAFFPYFVFLLAAAAVGYSLYEPHLLRTISVGIFFIFCILAVHRAKLLWREGKQ